MNKVMIITIVVISAWLGGCSSLHDGQGWEHTGDPVTHEDTQPYILEHDH